MVSICGPLQLLVVGKGSRSEDSEAPWSFLSIPQPGCRMVMIGLVLIEKRDQGNRERVSCSLWMEFDATVYFLVETIFRTWHRCWLCRCPDHEIPPKNKHVNTDFRGKGTRARGEMLRPRGSLFPGGGSFWRATKSQGVVGTFAPFLSGGGVSCFSAG